MRFWCFIWVCCRFNKTAVHEARAEAHDFGKSEWIVLKKKKAGLSRHPVLYPLSHHHHHALVAALRLKQAGTEKSKLSLEEVVKEVRAFWEPGGKEHFREEEEILLPAYAKYASVERPEIMEMLLEHVMIRSKMDMLMRAGEKSSKWMNELGQLLEAHVRKEERVIFPMIEKALPEEALQELAPYLHVHDEKKK